MKPFQKIPMCISRKFFGTFAAPHTLTMEKVDFFKIDDLETIEAAGISGVQVADKLYRIYMEQVFETYFVHVDPHPGNLFVKPLPTAEESEAGVVEFSPGDPVPYQSGRPFQIVFVDFGMAVTIPERLRTALGIMLSDLVPKMPIKWSRLISTRELCRPMKKWIESKKPTRPFLIVFGEFGSASSEAWPFPKQSSF
jgi:hypothetical protein